MLTALGDIDLKLIRVFMAIVEGGGFRPAQAVLNVTPSRLSTMMSDLETRLGRRLCQRGRVGFRLTEDGAQVYKSAQRLVAGIEGFRTEVAALSGKVVGNLALGMVDNMVTNPDAQVDAAIARYRARDHDVHITMTIDAPQELELKVLDGRLDLAIGAFHRTAPGLSYDPLLLEAQSLYCGNGHPLFDRRRGEIGRDQIREAAYAGRGYLEESRPLELVAKATSYSMEGLAMLVLSGAFIAYLPRHYAAQWVRSGRMREIEPEALTYPSLFCVVTRKGGVKSRALVDFLADIQVVHPPFAPPERAPARSRRPGPGPGKAPGKAPDRARHRA